MKHEIYVTITYHYERIPKILHGIVSKKYMNNRSAVVDIFNKYIGVVNETFDKTGLPYLVNDQSDDFNPEYIKCIRKIMQPRIDILNKNFRLCRYFIGDDAEIIGYVPFIKKSKIWITIHPLDEA